MEIDPRRIYKPPLAAEWRAMYAEWRKGFPLSTTEWRNQKVRGCLKKIPYDRRIMATLESEKLEPREGYTLGVYECIICKKYHIGNSRRGMKD